jgi:CRP-like cAMP-binding protein
MEAFLPDWLSGSSRRASARSAANPFALLCKDCGSANQRTSRPSYRVSGYPIGEIRHQHIAVEAGMDIITLGGRGRGVHILCDGWAARYHRLRGGTRQILDVLLPGDAFALASVLTGASQYSVQALTSAKVCLLNGRQIVNSLKNDPGFALAVLRTRVEEERRVDARLTLLGRMSAEEKISYFLVETYDRLRQRGLADDTSCPFPLRRADLADAVGLSKVHVLRALRTLRSQAMMEINGRYLVIPDVARLADYVGYVLA